MKRNIADIVFDQLCIIYMLKYIYEHTSFKNFIVLRYSFKLKREKTNETVHSPGFIHSTIKDRENWREKKSSQEKNK